MTEFERKFLSWIACFVLQYIISESFLLILILSLLYENYLELPRIAFLSLIAPALRRNMFLRNMFLLNNIFWNHSDVSFLSWHISCDSFY